MILPSVARCLQDGLKLDSFSGPLTLRIHEIGTLPIPSGRLAAGDPAFLKDASILATPIDNPKPLIVLSIATYTKDRDQRIAAATVRLSSQPVTNWQETRPLAYGVDSGLACFADAELASHLGHLALGPHQRYWDALDDSLAANFAETRCWALIIPDRGRQAGLVAFSSGFGDGGYPCYLGTDSQGRPAAILTDFGLLMTKPEINALE